MKNISWLIVFGSTALLAAAPACSSDDSSGTGGSGTGGAAGSGTGGMSGSGTGGMSGSGTGGMSGSGTGGAAGGSGTHAACTGAAAKVKAVAASLGCTDNSADVAALVRKLYTGGKCTAEFETLVGCASAKADSDWECGTGRPGLQGRRVRHRADRVRHLRHATTGALGGTPHRSARQSPAGWPHDALTDPR